MRIKEATPYGFSIKEIGSVKIYKTRISLDDLTPPPGSSFDNYDERICMDFCSFDGNRVARIRDDELPEGLALRDLENIIFEKGYLDLTSLEKYVKWWEKYSKCN